MTNEEPSNRDLRTPLKPFPVEGDRGGGVTDITDRSNVTSTTSSSQNGVDVRVIIDRAHGVRRGDQTGKSDPFVEVFLSAAYLPKTGAVDGDGDGGDASKRSEVILEDEDSEGHSVYSTPTRWSTLDPIWNDEIVLRNVPETSKVLFRVWDRDAYIRNDWLGDAVTDLIETVRPGTSSSSTSSVASSVASASGPTADEPLSSETVSELNLPIKWNDEEVSGTLDVAFEILGVTEHPHLPTRRDGKIHWSRHFSKSAGIMSTGLIKSLLRGEKGYHTYAVDLHKTEEIFGNIRQRWCRTHPPAAQIFREGPAGEAIRTAVRTQHRYLYQQKIGSEEGLVLDTRGLFDLMEWGRRRNKPRIFTFVVSHGQFRFSETGDSFVKDALSKHAVLADAATEVIYSGEFFVVPSRCSPDVPADRAVEVDSVGALSPDRDVSSSDRDVSSTAPPPPSSSSSTFEITENPNVSDEPEVESHESFVAAASRRVGAAVPLVRRAFRSMRVGSASARGMKEETKPLPDLPETDGMAPPSTETAASSTPATGERNEHKHQHHLHLHHHRHQNTTELQQPHDLPQIPKHITNLPPTSVQVSESTALPLLVLTNSSGTYAPDKTQLPKLEELFRANFSDIRVIALDLKDDRLKDMKKFAELDKLN